MKKLLAILSSLFILLSFPASVVAGGIYDYEDNAVIVVNTDALFNVFDTNKVDAVFYEYTFDTDADATSAHINLDYQIWIRDIAYTGSASGDVFPVYLNDAIFWEGPIYGTVLIDNEVCPVLVGFNKFDGNDEVQLAFTIAVPSKGENSTIFLCVGADIVTEDILDAIRRTNFVGELNTLEQIDISQPVYETNQTGNRPIIWDDGGGTEVIDNFVLQGYHSYPLNTNSNVTAGGISVYFSNDNRVMICTHTFCDNVQSTHIAYGATRFTYVESIGFSLVREDCRPTGMSYIAGFERCDLSNELIGATNVSLSPLFEDAIGYFGIPTATITAALSNFNGQVMVSGNSDAYTVDLIVALGNNFNPDAITCGVPLVFQLAKASGLYEGGSIYTAGASVTYRTLYIFDNPIAMPQFYTQSVSNMELTIEVDLL